MPDYEELVGSGAGFQEMEQAACAETMDAEMMDVGEIPAIEEIEEMETTEMVETAC